MEPTPEEKILIQKNMKWKPLEVGKVRPSYLLHDWMVLGIFWNHICAIKHNLHTPAFQCLKKPGAICRVALLRGILSFSKYTSFGDGAWVLLRRAENHCNWPRITKPHTFTTKCKQHSCGKHLFLNDRLLHLETWLITLTQEPQAHRKYCLFHLYHWMSYLHLLLLWVV